MIPLLPLKLEHAIREVALQFERRRRLQGRLMFGVVFLGLLAALWLTVVFVDRLPVIMPVLGFLALIFFVQFISKHAAAERIQQFFFDGF